MTTDERIAQAKEDRAFQGKKRTDPALPGQAAHAISGSQSYCYDCSGYYDGGAEDCGVAHCPLQPYAPYSASKAPKRLLSEVSRAKMRLQTVTRKIEDSEVALPGLGKHVDRRSNMKNEAAKPNNREILRKLIKDHKAEMRDFHLDFLRDQPTDIFVEMWAATERREKYMKNRKKEDRILCGECIERIRSYLIKVLSEFAKRSRNGSGIPSATAS
jgi:hypothetical protein